MKKIGKNGKLRDFKLLGIIGILIIFVLWNINCKVGATTDDTTTDNETKNNATTDSTTNNIRKATT